MTARASRTPLWRRLRWGVVAALAALAILVAVLVVVKRQRLIKERRRLAEQEAQGPLVQAADVRWSAGRRPLTFIGEARPFAEVTLYAKVSGYLRGVHADKGDRVRRGQVLAVIESPETDRDYQAAVANARNLEAIARRYKPLLRKNFVSQQEADQAFANADVAKAQAGALRVLQSYEKLAAPFDGLVTARYADEGALVQNAQNGSAGALPVFTVSDVDRLRVFVYVDQTDAPYVHPGDPVTLTAADSADKKVQARITRLAGQLDDRTRTLLTEIDVDNAAGTFVPGSLLAAHLQVSAPRRLLIPAEAVVPRGQGAVVAVIASDSTLQYRPISLGANDGVNAEVLSGLQEGERVALNVGESIAAGTRVRVAGPPQGPSGFGKGGRGGQGAQSGTEKQVQPR